MLPNKNYIRYTSEDMRGPSARRVTMRVGYENYYVIVPFLQYLPRDLLLKRFKEILLTRALVRFCVYRTLRLLKLRHKGIKILLDGFRHIFI